MNNSCHDVNSPILEPYQTEANKNST